MKHVLLIAMVLFSAASFAQTGQQEITNYSAERVMKYRSKIELKPDQVDFIRGLYNQNTGEFNNLKWDLDEANLQLSELLKESKVDSANINNCFISSRIEYRQNTMEGKQDVLNLCRVLNKAIPSKFENIAPK